MAFTYLTVTGQWGRPGMPPFTGEVEFIPTEPFTNGDTTVSAPVVAALAHGQISIQLPATDDAGTTPRRVLYRVHERIPRQGWRPPYYINAPAAGGPIDLTTATRLDGSAVAPSGGQAVTNNELSEILGAYVGGDDAPTDGSVTDDTVAADANIAQAKIAGLVDDLAAKASAADIADATSGVRTRALLPSHTLAWRTITDPPTITEEADGESTISGEWVPQILPTAAGQVALWGAGGFDHPPGGYPLTMVWRPSNRAPDVNANTSGHYKIAFCTDAVMVDVMTYVQVGSYYRIKIDDEYVDTDPSTPTPNAGVFDRILIDFTAAGGARPRKIVIETNMDFAGLNIPATATMWPAVPRGPRTVFFGDSYTHGSDGVDTTWPARATELLGWDDIWHCAIGGTGYLNTVGAGGNAAADQVAALAADPAWAPDVVIGTWGHNDTDTASAIATEAAAVWTTIASTWPAALLICGGPFWVGGTAGLSTAATKETAIFAAIDDIVDHLIPQAIGDGVPWFTGTGNVGATTGSGNSDIYVSSDEVHPTQAGHDYLGERMASVVTGLLGT